VSLSAYGQVRQLAEIYESNSSVVYRVGQRILKDTEDAADATQEVFLRAFASLTAETQGEKARTWLIAVARHHCLDVLRRKKRLRKTLGAGPMPNATISATLPERDEPTTERRPRMTAIVNIQRQRPATSPNSAIRPVNQGSLRRAGIR